MSVRTRPLQDISVVEVRLPSVSPTLEEILMKRCFRSVLATDGGAGARPLVRPGRLQHRLDRGDRRARPETPREVDADAFPVTIEHAFGETTIEEEPTRVATLGWSDQDVALALGVVPVGAIAITWGGNDEESTPWFDERLEELGAEQPARYNDADGAPIEEIAKLAART